MDYPGPRPLNAMTPRAMSGSSDGRKPNGGWGPPERDGNAGSAPRDLRRGPTAVPPSPSVFVVEDDHGVCESLRILVESVHLPVETYRTAQAFLEAVDGSRPGCVVLDVRLPGMSGLELQQELANRRIGLPIIMITGYGDVPTAVRALKAGAFDFIEKPFSRQLLLDRISQAIEADRKARQREAERAAVAARISRLTPREREVMELVITGRTNKAIAMELGLCEKTVEVHRAQVMRKIQVLSVAELVRLTSLALAE